MSTFQIPYGDRLLPFQVPDSFSAEILQPGQIDPAENPLEEIRRALHSPIGMPRLAESARGAKKVVLLADDLTRSTPVHWLIPALLDELNMAGISDRQILVLVALGTHRPMTPVEIEARFTTEVTRRVKVLNNPWQDPAQMVDLACTPNGTPIEVSRIALEADYIIGLGSIVPHHIPGFAGGAKIVQPGISGAITTGATHLFSTRTRRSYLGELENPIRAEMEWIAEQVGLKAILNTVLDSKSALVSAFFGEPRQAFRQGVKLARKVWGSPISGLVDIAIASSHPCDIEFWQAHKTLYPADKILHSGGTLLLVTPCPEGISRTHAQVLEYAGLSSQEILHQIDTNIIKDVAAGALALAWAKVRERVKVVLVSDGISAKEAHRLGFSHQSTDNFQDAIEENLKLYGPGARLAILPFAPDTLPLLPGEE